MLVRYELWPCVRVRPAFTSRCSIEMSGRIEVVLAWRLSLCLTLCYEKIKVITSKSNLEKVVTVRRLLQGVINLTGQRWSLNVVN